ncbi:MAG: hypothetical protein ABFS32_02585 [Bacteroidota bacterium]
MKISNIYILLLAALVIVACDPLSDVNKEIEDNKTFVDDLIYTLTDDDYELADESYGTFSNIEDVKAKVPLILKTNFPALGKNSSALVSYEFYNGSSPDLGGDYTELTVPSEDYDLFHGKDTYDNFGNPDEEVAEYANWKFPDAGDGDYADITFDYYDGSFHAGAVSRVVYTVAYGWQYASILPDDVYGDFFSESGTDFSTKSEGAEKMPSYLNYLYSTANDYYSLNLEAGDKIVIQYNFDDWGGSGDPNVPAVALYIFSGTEWISYGDAYQTTTESLDFGHDGTVWVPDNTVKYTFTSADYAVCGDEANGLGNAAARDNIRSYGNFGTQWSHAEIIEAIGFVLKLNFPASEEGQKYFVTYNTYPAGDLTALLILDASGDYVEMEN